ncbi:IS5 family transposase [Parvibaculum sp.]|uniref:IS5 family transposase n=1 Tax=Parvibaculum sp. TaxID=2024848 RepID=UPI00320F0BDF
MIDAEWEFFEPFVVAGGPLSGRPPSDHRRTLDGIFWITRTGAPWRDLPGELGKWNSVYRQFLRWSRSGLWDLLLEALADSGVAPKTIQMIDSTVIRAHHQAAGGKRGTQNQGLGRSRGGFTSKIHARTNGEGLPLGFVITPGEAHDATAYDALMKQEADRPKTLLADKAYDTDAIRADLKRRGIKAVIPPKANRKVAIRYNKRLYRERNCIERVFGHLKINRAIATRYDQLAETFLDLLFLASARYWLKVVHAA